MALFKTLKTACRPEAKYGQVYLNNNSRRAQVILVKRGGGRRWGGKGGGALLYCNINSTLYHINHLNNERI